jgi:Ca2+-binding EF-hand superfamily protein
MNQSARFWSGRLFSLAMIAVSVAAVGARASAQPHTQSAISSFHAIDTDRDAKLDRRELTAAAGRDFDKLDVDRDGYLTGSELTRTRDKRLFLPFPGRFASAAAFAAADTDRDRKIDKHEYEVAVVKAYMRCDRNRDGTIEISDLRTCSL